MTWRLALAAFLTLCLTALGQQSRAQFNGCSAGFCGGTSVATYQGPGDLFSSWVYWHSVNSCFTLAYSGNVADITDASTGNTTGTRMVCNNGIASALVSSSACTFVTGNACSALATTCAVSCNLREAYDQTGNVQHMPQTANANRPAVVTTGCGSMGWCVQCVAASTQYLTKTSGTPTIAVPFNLSAAINPTSASGRTEIMGQDSSPTRMLTIATNTIQGQHTGSGFPTQSITTGAWHEVQITQNGTSGSNVNVDGVDGSTSMTSGTGSASGNMGICGSGVGSLPYNGYWMESGVNNGSAWNLANRQAMEANQKTRLGI